MDQTDLVYALAFVTLAIALAFGIWQFFRAKQAKSNHEHSELAHHPGGGMTDHDRKTQHRN